MTTSSPDNMVSSPPSVASVLGQVGAELVQLATSVQQLETVIGRLATDNSALNGDDCAILQNADYLRQSLEALADFTLCLSEQPLEHGEVDTAAAASAITLRELANRLQNCAGDAVYTPDNTENDGDLAFL